MTRTFTPNSNFKLIIKALGLALACAGAASPTLADTYPSKPVRIIVPYGTGGGSDTLARQLGLSLQQIWGQGVTVDNRLKSQPVREVLSPQLSRRNRPESKSRRCR